MDINANNLDFRECSKVDLRNTSLTFMGEISFAVDSDVNLKRAKLPRNVDVSNCANLDMENVVVSKTRRLVFKDFDQKRDMLRIFDSSKYRGWLIVKGCKNPFARYEYRF